MRLARQNTIEFKRIKWRIERTRIHLNGGLRIAAAKPAAKSSVPQTRGKAQSNAKSAVSVRNSGTKKGTAPEEDKVLAALAHAKRQRDKKKKSVAVFIICAVAVLSVIATIAGYLIWYKPSISDKPRFPTNVSGDETGDDYVPTIQK